MEATGALTVPRYLLLLQSDELERRRLRKALTIHVSHFFRNPSLFQKLRDEVFPHLFAQCREQHISGATVLSLGCAAGEEPYSLALLLWEQFRREMRRTRLSIVGLDVDEESLVRAERAEYTEERLKEVPPRLLERCFHNRGTHFRLASEVRGMVSFRQADLSALSHLEPSPLIVCRNTLIYFSREEQERILLQLAGMIPVGGFLVLGKTETLLGPARKLYDSYCPVERIYRKR